MMTVDSEATLLARIPGQLPAFIVGMRSFLGVPLFFRDDLIGVLQLQSKEQNAYSQWDFGLAERIGNQIAGAVANSQLYSEFKRLAAENLVMAEIGRIIGSSVDPDEVYDRAGEVLREVIPFDQSVLSLIDRQKGTVTPTWMTGTYISGRSPGDEVPLEGTLSLGVMQNRSPLIVDVEDEEDVRRRFPGLISHFRAGLKSFIATPLVYHDDVIGVLQLGSVEANSYSHPHLELAERAGNQIAGAVATSQIYSELVYAEKSTRASENKYRTLVNESPDMIFVSRIDNFRLTEVNGRACEHYGYSSEEFLTMEIFDLEVEPPLKQQIKEMYDNTPVGRVLEVYGANKRKDGLTFPVHVRFSKLDDEFAIANVRDITDQRAAEETQRQWAGDTEAMAEIGRTISSSLNIGDVY